MPDVLGHAITFSTPVTADFREPLKAIYDDINAGNWANWSIDNGVTRPAQIANPGDTGFAARNSNTNLQIFFADHAAASLDGTMVDGTAINASDDLLFAIDPSGLTTSMVGAGLSPAFSGWTSDAQSTTSGNLDGRMKVSFNDNAVFGRFKTAGTNKYEGGFYGGQILRMAAREGSRFAGWLVAAGEWSTWASTSNGGHNCAMRLDDTANTWGVARCFPNNGNTSNQGLGGDHASNGAGQFTISRVSVVFPGATFSSTANTWTTVGALQFLMTGPTEGTLAKAWTEAATTIGYNINGRSWIALDNQLAAE